MRHGMANRKLGRTSSHRAAMFRNQLASLIENERIITTLPKAKELRPLAEKLITLARNDSVHARRQAARTVPNDALIAKLFDTLGPRFSTRPGGYTRIMKLGARRGDAAEMAILELVERSADASETKSAAPAAPAKSSSKKKAAPAPEPAEDEKPKRTRKAAPKADTDEAAPAEEKPKRTRKKKEE
ncbi:MAG: 50S ribosomal protein L17 [Acidobacteria bacterium]|nr:50S ribosomal protein L17 [Acidobacteriota bacterium]MBV9475566.1 50S ribosomal protein L17 [Acidobacteriota bacterium]